MPDEVFWEATLAEIMMLIDRIQDRRFQAQRNATLRAGMIAAEIRNSMRTKRSDRVWEAKDFVASPPQELTPEQMRDVMDQWARSTNQRARA